MTAVISEARIPDDADALARVYVASTAHHAALDPARYRVPPLDAVARRYREPRPDAERILVARLGRYVVGFASVALLLPPGPASMLAAVPTATLDVAVLPEHRGHGIGRRWPRRRAPPARRAPRERGCAAALPRPRLPADGRALSRVVQ